MGFDRGVAVIACFVGSAAIHAVPKLLSEKQVRSITKFMLFVAVVIFICFISFEYIYQVEEFYMFSSFFILQGFFLLLETAMRNLVTDILAVYNIGAPQPITIMNRSMSVSGSDDKLITTNGNSIEKTVVLVSDEFVWQCRRRYCLEVGLIIFIMSLVYTTIEAQRGMAYLYSAGITTALGGIVIPQVAIPPTSAAASLCFINATRLLFLHRQ